MEKPLVKLILNKVQVEALLADNQVCGNGRRDAFVANIELQARDLDARGFVVDSLEFIAAVRESYHPSRMRVASCEQLAEGIVEVAYRTIPRLVSCKAIVFNETGFVEVEWHDGQQVPLFPREATEEEKRATRSTISTPRSGC